jgi:hypothetical protein
MDVLLLYAKPTNFSEDGQTSHIAVNVCTRQPLGSVGLRFLRHQRLQGVFLNKCSVTLTSFPRP